MSTYSIRCYLTPENYRDYQPTVEIDGMRTRRGALAEAELWRVDHYAVTVFEDSTGEVIATHRDHDVVTVIDASTGEVIATYRGPKA